MAKYNLEFKLQVVTEYLNGQEDYKTLAKRYGIPDQKTVRKWGAIPAGKIYLSPIVDCFDGLLVTWKKGEEKYAYFQKAIFIFCRNTSLFSPKFLFNSNINHAF